MSRTEIMDMQTGEPTVKQIARENAAEAKFMAKCKAQCDAVDGGYPDSDYDSYGRYIGPIPMAKQVPNDVADDIDF